MKIKALKFSLDSSDVAPSRIELNYAEDHDLKEIKEKEAPVALLIRTSELTKLAEKFPNLLEKLGTKHRGKRLADYLLKRKKIPLIDGNYKQSYKVEWSLQKLLENARAENDNNLYIVGAKDRIFAKFWPEAIDDDGTMSDFSSKSLVELLTQVEVPQELCKTFIGTSVEAKLVRCLIMLAAGIDDHVLILGDTGTGKEVVARAIHDYKFSNNEFYPLNCAAISPYLLESELFGLRKGYPSLSSKVDKIGLWEAAKNGTLFLDEIGELRPDHQTKILRVLQEGYFRRVGGTEEIKAEARVIAATNRDIFQMAKNGQYREDLYYRLRGFIIRTPALRDHPEDIPLLAQSFWRNICGEKYNDLPPEIYSKLQEYGWPGNARELKMVLIGLHAFFGSANLTLKHLNAIFAYERQAVASRPEAVAKPETIWPRLDYLRHLRRIEEVIRVTKVTLQPVVQEHKTDLPTVTEVHNGLRFHLNELEVLCLHPSSFPSESTFSLVHDLKGKIAVFQGLLPKDLQHALRYWKKELAEGVEKVLSTIASELQKLLDNP